MCVTDCVELIVIRVCARLSVLASQKAPVGTNAWRHQQLDKEHQEHQNDSFSLFNSS